MTAGFVASLVKSSYSGKKKLYSGIVQKIHHLKPEKFEPKEVLSLLDSRPIVSLQQLQFWNWLASYYMCTTGEVMQAGLPNGLKLASETVFSVNTEFSQGFDLKVEDRFMLEHVAEMGSMTLEDIRNSTFGTDGIRIVKRLVESGALTTDQFFRKGYKPRRVSCIRISPEYKKEKDLVDLLESLKRSSAQVKALEEFAGLSGMYDRPGKEPREVERQELTAAGVTASAIASLVKKGIFLPYEKLVSRIHHQSQSVEIAEAPELDGFQEEALKKIRDSFATLPVSLLHGITSSGKTEVYIRLIQEQVDAGKQVLYLLPEIALTSQIIQRLKKYFGDKIAVYHSKYSDNERVEVYRNLAGLTEKAPCSIVLGVRSAIFLPFNNLGLVIVDEEHENTYKQHDPAPRYHARDAATILGLFTGAKVLLGTATPSFETLYNVKTGKYGLAEMFRRYGNSALPEIIIADIARARKRKQMKEHFTPELITAMKETLEAGRQVILFQNRRGYSNYLLCEDCGFILKCNSCDVSMTYHKVSHEMQCHYCGTHMHVPHHCPDCNSTKFRMQGFGTERIEDEIEILFPGYKSGRLDLDQARSRSAFEKVIDDFEKGRIQILIGTQLVTKGLDFENVTLVGILDADSMLNFPDFRAFERSFQLMVQVSGRAGRREEQGKVVIQTMDTEHPVINYMLANDFQTFFRDQMAERKMFRYPPFVRLIQITLRHEIPSILDGGAVFLAGELKEIFGSRVLGPIQPVVSRTHGKYIKQILLKIEKEASVEKAKGLVGELLDIFAENPVYKQIRRTVDVDPM